MRLAVVGLGQFNTREHAPSILRYIDEVAPIEIVLCEPDPGRLHAWQQRFGTHPAYASVDAMLVAERLDAALVTVPPEVTCGVVETLLRAGVPALTEKPPGLTADETRRLIRAAGELPHAVAFNRRFIAVLRRAREIVRDAGAEVRFIGCEFHRTGRYDPDFTTTLIHGIDALRSLGGDFAELAVRKPLVAGDPPFRNWLITGTFRSGALWTITSLPVSGRWVERYTLVMRDVTVVAQLSQFGQGSPGDVRVFRDGKVESTEDDASLGVAEGPECVRFGVYDEVKQFLDAVRLGPSPAAVPGCPDGGRGDPGTSFREALQSVEVAEFLRNCPDTAHWTARETH
ncbi:MAG TPA: Gfo/Idh/MocA family oxidoreductase [Planctomycetota bacterium]|nr:Gfo/Idh/MocA family oxidoreductase [Planctomycetota bacterium]